MATDDDGDGGSRRNIGENEYLSSEDCISPIMSQETFEDLHNNSANLIVDHELFRDLDLNNVLLENEYNERMSRETQFVIQEPVLDVHEVISTWDVSHPVIDPAPEVQQPSHSGATGSLNESQFSNVQGKHGFDVIFKENEIENLTKSAPWTYSKVLDQLFVSFNLPCPVQFLFSSSPPFGTVIRATPYFKQPVSFQYPVLRCLNHQRKDDINNQGFDGHLEHILRCESPGADYHSNCSSGRVSVVLPYPEGRDAQSFVSFNYRFMCYSSCIGGMNRRPIVVVFTLEHGNNVIGQKTLEVRICASPGRDRQKAEAKYFENLAKVQGHDHRQTAPIQANLKRGQSEIPKTSDGKKKPPPKKKKLEHNEDDDQIMVSINFLVRGKNNAEIYQNILNSIKKEASQIRDN